MVIHGGYFCPTVSGLLWAGGHARTPIRNVLYLDHSLDNNRAARSFRYTVLPVGSRSRLRSYMGPPIGLWDSSTKHSDYMTATIIAAAVTVTACIP